MNRRQGNPPSSSSTFGSQTCRRTNFSGKRPQMNRNQENLTEGVFQSIGRGYRSTNTNFNQTRQRRNFDPNQRPNGANYHQVGFKNDAQYTRGDNSTNHQRRGHFGFKALVSLLENDPEKLLMELSNGKRGIIEYVKSALTNDGIVLCVKILKVVCESPFEDLKNKVLQTYLDDTFLHKLKNYIVSLPTQDKHDQKTNQYFWKNPDDFWYNLIKITQEINDTIPTFGRKVLPKILKSLIVCFRSFEEEHKRHISDEIKTDLYNLNSAVAALVQEYEEKEAVDLQRRLTNNEDELEPPDDFRQLSVYPTTHELLSDKCDFLRVNVIDRPYRDVRHYLDVQFRLLKEDFVSPLRSGIKSYRSNDAKRYENVKIHRKVRFLNPETINESYCVRLRFDFSKKKKKFTYENSRRFMFGSLLCFTCDNFKYLTFGKISDRKPEDLEKGELIVGFDQNPDVLFNVDYLMVECSVYFEPYYHVLKVLQHMSFDNFPMERYIIGVNRSVKPPGYLEEESCTYQICGSQFSPLINWPSRNFYNLNKSQQEAFKAALTQEFCIIQGPPGTGKTYLGLKVAKTLIENCEVWYDDTPMLVICYTNHALDQFLEGMLEFTTNILRVGGQSKNEKLKRFSLRNRHNFKLSPALAQQRETVREMLSNIKNITENLKQIDEYKSIRNFEVFRDVVENFSRTWFGRAKQDEILDWLMGAAESENRQLVQAQRAVIEIQQQTDDMEISDDEDMGSESEDILDENEPQDEDIFEIDLKNVQCSSPLVTVSSFEAPIAILQNRLEQLKINENPEFHELLEEEKITADLHALQNKRDYLIIRLEVEKNSRTVRRVLPVDLNLTNPHSMSHNDRWKLYFYWLDLYRTKLFEKLQHLNKEFRNEFKIYEEMRDVQDTNTMKNVLVVGMTTTGAARLRSSLQALKSPIVIVEEAAEVLEAHIISSLTTHCQHLILIGDHKQLRPSTADYNVERYYNLGISLFERMVLNKIQLYTLDVQHRMRPEISSLITPTIYPILENHPSVNDRPSIIGVENCLFFIDHDHPEDECEGTSKKNLFEVKFLINLAKHLILNGYRPENITILAAYLGQMFEMQKLKKKYSHVLRDIRIAVLDNYQGEESDIILLSLVRNNDKNNIGFLSIENRVCVALSRARNGFYLMGNMSKLCAASDLWRKINATLVQQNAIGNKLTLRCQVHPDTVTEVETDNDFLKIAEGGCSQKCGAALICGHQCTSLCHVLDRDHTNYKCRTICNKNLCETNPTHLCKKMCFEECGPCCYKVRTLLACGHVVDIECHINVDDYDCCVEVSTKLPCGHVNNKPCHRDAKTFRCRHPCEIKVEPCGHACSKTCHVRVDPDHLQYQCRTKCARYRQGCTVETENHRCRKLCYEECEPCEIPVKKQRSVCPHVYVVPCNVNVDVLKCEKPCKEILPCGHPCKQKCCEPCAKKCEKLVEKINPICKHPIKVKCCDEANRTLCNKKCPLLLPCGHPCTKRCNEPCTAECQVEVQTKLVSPCGHTITEVPCHIVTSKHFDADPEILKFCNHPCNYQLKCKHKCSGTCGECYQGRIHKSCSEKCGFPLVCNHPCEFPCRQACRPCSKRCTYKCRHNGRVIFCGNRCGDICTPCKEPCSRKCQHQKCNKFCGDICDVQPCVQPCEERLRCGHQCVGFCGDPCPPKCLVCDKDELTAVFFGFEEEEDARFVLLEDCRHIFESQGLDHWMKQDDGKIGFKLCPQCKTPIQITARYSDLIKQTMADVAEVKKNFCGTSQENLMKRNELKVKLVLLTKKHIKVFPIHCPSVDKVFNIIAERLKTVKNDKRQPINKQELNALESKLQVIEHVVNICADTKIKPETSYSTQIALIMEALSRNENVITDQEIDDIQYELNRLSRLVEYKKIENSRTFLLYSANPRVKPLVTIIRKYLLSLKKFENSDDQRVSELLRNLKREVASTVEISDQERREIVRAVGLKQGHWYKCRNGHPYTIGDCGGAMVEAKCLCGAPIGGTHHRLLSDNAVATEMDGAQHSAWSEAANMANYRF